MKVKKDWRWQVKMGMLGVVVSLGAALIPEWVVRVNQPAAEIAAEVAWIVAGGLFIALLLQWRRHRVVKRSSN